MVYKVANVILLASILDGGAKNVMRTQQFRNQKASIAPHAAMACLAQHLPMRRRGHSLVCGSGLRRCLRRGILRRAKVHLWHLTRAFRCCEIRIVRLEPGPSRKDVVWELLDVSVVVLERVVVTLALDCNTIFRSRQFVLQTQEVL